MNVQELNEQMQAFIEENRGFPMGYAWTLEQAEQDDTVPVPLYGELYRTLWFLLTKVNGDLDAPEDACVPDGADSDSWPFTTDVNTVKGSRVVVIPANRLKKAGILNPDALPVHRNGGKSWGAVLDDVYRQGKHYEFVVDKTCLPDLADEETVWMIKRSAEAQQMDAAWREQLPKVCCTAYFNRLYALAETEEERYYVWGQLAKAKLLGAVRTDLLAEDLREPVKKPVKG